MYLHNLFQSSSIPIFILVITWYALLVEKKPSFVAAFHTNSSALSNSEGGNAPISFTINIVGYLCFAFHYYSSPSPKAQVLQDSSLTKRICELHFPNYRIYWILCWGNMTPHISKVKLPFSNKEHLAPEALVRWSYKMALVQVHLQGRDFESQRGRAPCPSPLPLNDQKNKKTRNI